MKKICLITPPSPFLLDERVFMHIGILKVASSLEQKGYNVDFLDLSGIDNYSTVIEDYCKTNNVISAYKKYYINEKVRFATWKNRSVPLWFQKKDIMI